MSHPLFLTQFGNSVEFLAVCSFSLLWVLFLFYADRILMRVALSVSLSFGPLETTKNLRYHLLPRAYLFFHLLSLMSLLLKELLSPDVSSDRCGTFFTFKNIVWRFFVSKFHWSRSSGLCTTSIWSRIRIHSLSLI